MVDKSFICIIKDGTYRHPIYYCQGGQPQLLEYCPIEELNETLNHYAQTYNVNNVVLDGHIPLMAGIRDQIYHENIAKYGYNTLNIEISRKDN